MTVAESAGRAASVVNRPQPEVEECHVQRRPSTNMISRSLIAAQRLCCGAAAWLITAATALGQDAAAPAGGASSVVVSGRPLYVEGALVLVLFGAALFAVCRSSNRN